MQESFSFRCACERCEREERDGAKPRPAEKGGTKGKGGGSKGKEKGKRVEPVAADNAESAEAPIPRCTVHVKPVKSCRFCRAAR